MTERAGDVLNDVRDTYLADGCPLSCRAGSIAAATSSQRNTRKFCGLLFIAIMRPWGSVGPSAADEMSRPSVASAPPRRTAISLE